MREPCSPIDPDEVERRYAERLEEAGLPRFDSTFHDRALNELQLSWDHGFTIHHDLASRYVEPFDGYERSAILGLPPGGDGHEPVDLYVGGCADDPRAVDAIPGVLIHRGPALHPDDRTVLHGIPVTSPSRTLIDCAEFMTLEELRDAFARAQELGLLDPEALRMARARVEWRPSLRMLDDVIQEFCD